MEVGVFCVCFGYEARNLYLIAIILTVIKSVGNSFIESLL